MKKRIINERPDWEFWVADNVADWDAPSHWERRRCFSMEEKLKPGMVLLDVGAEHGWLSALYASFVGPENMVLIEPSPEFWPNIRKTWAANGYADPLACWAGFVSNVNKNDSTDFAPGWPLYADLDAPECGGMAYRYLFGEHDIPAITIDTLALTLGRPVDAITIDIEGAELLAIHGATDVLTYAKPLVWISIHPDLMERDFGQAKQELLDLMDRRRYDGTLLEIDHEEHWLFLPRGLA